MRDMAFSYSAAQIRNRTQDVTRRVGWQNLKPGDVLMAVEKCEGVEPGQRVRLGPIRVVSVRREQLHRITAADIAREGFPGLSAVAYMTHFRRTAGPDVTGTTVVTRIEFEYVDPMPEGYKPQIEWTTPFDPLRGCSPYSPRTESPYGK